jgi:hypothetical protein
MGKEPADYFIAVLGSTTAIPPLLFRLFKSDYWRGGMLPSNT